MRCRRANALTLGSLWPGGRSWLRMPSITWRINCSRTGSSLFLVSQKRMLSRYHDTDEDGPSARASARRGARADAASRPPAGTGCAVRPGGLVQLEAGSDESVHVAGEPGPERDGS